MAQFRVELTREVTLLESVILTVEAKDADEAEEKALEIGDDDPGALDWNEDNGTEECGEVSVHRVERINAAA